MTTSSDGLITILDAFLAAPLDGITLPTEGSLLPQNGNRLNSSISLLQPSKSNEALYPLKGAVKQQQKATASSTADPSTSSTEKWTNSNLSFPTVDDTEDNTKRTNAAKCTTFDGNLDQSKVQDFLRTTYGKTGVPSFVFPSLALTEDLQACLYNGKFFHQDSDIHYSHDVAKLLSRLLVAPLLPLTRLSDALKSSNERPLCSRDCYMACAIRKVFNSLIHHRLDFWIAKLQRAVDLEEDEVDTKNKRVLVALLDVQCSMKVDDDIDVSFRVVRNRSQSTVTAEMQEIVRMEQELADTLATMKSGARRFEPGSPLPSYLPYQARTKNAVEEKPKSNLFLPQLNNKGGKVTNALESVQEISLSVVMEARARVSAQIGDDLEHGHTVGFGVSGSVKGYYIKGGDEASAPKWIGIKLDLDTDELYSNMEKQARLVARSTAESVLLNAMTEKQAESDYNSADQEDSEGTQSWEEKESESTDEDESQEEEEPEEKIESPVPAKKTEEKAEELDNPSQVSSVRPLLRAAAFSPPISVSPIASPRRQYTPSPLQGGSQLPLVSPPPVPSLESALTELKSSSVLEDRHSLKPKRLGLGLMSGSFTLEPSPKRHKVMTSSDRIDADVVGALTALKNPVRCVK